LLVIGQDFILIFNRASSKRLCVVYPQTSDEHSTCVTECGEIYSSEIPICCPRDSAV